MDKIRKGSAKRDSRGRPSLISKKREEDWIEQAIVLLLFFIVLAPTKLKLTAQSFAVKLTICHG